MLISALYLCALLIGALDGAPVAAKPSPIDLMVKVDSSSHRVVITAGPFSLPNMPPGDGHAGIDHGASHDTPVQHFAWPVEGWLRGFRLEVRDARGNPLPRDLMHHMLMVNFDRRQLLYHAAERLLGTGTESEDARLPATVGVPLEIGTDLGFYIAWHNDTGEDLEGVELRIIMEYLPADQNPRPVSVLPIYMDVNLTVGGDNTYDLPPGRSEKSWEFTMPVNGRLLGVGGHMHDYGIEVRLEDAASGKELISVETIRDSSGRVEGVSRRLPGIRGRGVELQAGHRYRVVGVYDNPLNETIVNGAMAHIVGIFSPENMEEWPEIDPRDPIFQKDLEALRERGGGEHEHEGSGEQGAGSR